jgi:BCCT family betaine/carnitine transporter
MLFIINSYALKIKALSHKLYFLDRSTVTLAIILIISTSLFLLPKTAMTFFIFASNTVIEKLSAIYIIFGFFITIWIAYLVFGKYGKIKLGDKKEFSNIKWLSMLISVGVGPSIFYSSIIDWAYISPTIADLHKEPNSAAISYGFLHWGPIVWGICASLSVPIAINKHITNKRYNNISDLIIPSNRSRSARANIIDSLTMIGLLCGASTTLTIGILLISTCISEFIDISNSQQLKTIVLVLITLSFSASSILGLQKGMARLSTLSICLSFTMLLTITLVGPSAAIISNILNITQQTVSNSIQFIHNLNPFSPASITKSWTIFYWAWWTLYAPFMSLFIAKISSGRSIRQMLIAATVCSSLGCGAFYLVLGGFALELHNSHTLNIVATNGLTQPAQFISNIMGLLPWPKIWYVLLALCSSILLVTTFDAISHSLASVGNNFREQSQEPAKRKKLFWTLVIGIMPFTIINLNGDIALIKAIAIIASLPIMLLIFSGIITFILQHKKIYQAISIGAHYEMR